MVNKIFNKDNLDKCLFWLFNIFFASAIIFYGAFYCFANLTTSFREFLYLNNNYVDNAGSDILTVLFFIILFGIFCFLHIVIKFTSLQLIYKRTKNKYFTKYLEKFAASNSKRAFVTIGKMLALDAILSVFVMLVFFFIKIKTAPCYYITDDIISAVFSQTICYFYAVGGVTPCYIVFLIWYKFNHRKQNVWYNKHMNILNWILFVVLNIRLLSGINGFNLFLELFFWQFMGAERYEIAFFWVLLVFPLQFLILPVLYEFLNKKSQVFLFLNKQRNFIFTLGILFLAMLTDVFSVSIVSKLGGLNFEKVFIPFCCIGSIFAGYFSLVIWLKLRKCILFRLRKIMKFLGKWFGKRKFATLQNFIIALHLIFAGEIVALCFSPNKDSYLFLLFSEIMPLLLVEIISILSYAKKQKAQPFQRGVIFINSLLVFLYAQLAISILFLVDLI